MPNQEQKEVPYIEFWREEVEKELVRLFNGDMPPTYRKENIEVDLSCTPEEFAAQYFGAYHIL